MSDFQYKRRERRRGQTATISEGNGSGKKRRWVERVKTALIVLLSLSAAFLLTRTSLGGRPGGLFSGLFSLLPPPAAAETAAPLQGVVAHPVRVTVSNGKPGRFGVQYDQETVDARFGGSLLNLFSDALSAAATPQSVTQWEFQAALSSAEAGRPVVYLDLLSAIPGDQLPAWLGGRGANSALTGQVRRLFLTVRSGGAALYYCNDEDGSYYACAVSAPLVDRLIEAAAGFEPNGAHFAFEDPAYAGLSPYTLLFPNPPRPAVYRASNPIPARSEEQTALIHEIFSPQSGVVYLDDAVVREGVDNLRLSPAGVVRYSSSASGSPRYPVGDGSGDPTPAQMADAAWALLNRAVVPRIGAARLYQAGFAEEEGGTALYFAYQLDGASVQAGADGYAARFLFEGGRIAAFTLQLRVYEDTGETSVVLPELQAAAAMESLDAGGSELLLCYLDQGGEKVAAGWIAKSE